MTIQARPVTTIERPLQEVTAHWSVMEYSDRGKYVTEQVSMWICNDSQNIHDARYWLNTYGINGLREILIEKIKYGHYQSAAWHVRQELANNYFDRVDWESVAQDLKVQ